EVSRPWKMCSQNPPQKSEIHEQTDCGGTQSEKVSSFDGCHHCGHTHSRDHKEFKCSEDCQSQRMLEKEHQVLGPALAHGVKATVHPSSDQACPLAKPYKVM